MSRRREKMNNSSSRYIIMMTTLFKSYSKLRLYLSLWGSNPQADGDEVLSFVTIVK